MDLTITHKGRGESVTVPLQEEAGGQPFSVDFGKPELDEYQSGELQPRFNDSRSILETYTVATQLFGESAYDDAILLADLVKSRTGGGEELTVEVSGENLTDAYPTTETLVGPALEQQQALELTYSPGRRNVVDVEGQFTRVETVNGNANQNAQTPTAELDDEETAGPITLSDGVNTVELTEDVAITRTVGRPNTSIRATTNLYPNYTDPRKTAYDSFDIAFQMFSDFQAQADALAALFRQRLFNDPLTLDFNALFGLGSFAVVPEGSQAARIQRIAGRTDVENAPTLSLRRVFDPT